MQPNAGGGQGEPNIAQMFSQAYDTALREWAGVRDPQNDDLWVWCLFTGNWLDASAHAYADDVAEHISGQDLLQRIHRSGQCLDNVINPCKLHRNAEKEELLFYFCGRGSTLRHAVHRGQLHISVRPGAPATPALDASNTQFQQVRQHAEAEVQAEYHDMGVGKDLVRYLGNWLRFDGLGRENITKRLKAAREGFYAMGQFWRDRQVSVFFSTSPIQSMRVRGRARRHDCGTHHRVRRAHSRAWTHATSTQSDGTSLTQLAWTQVL